jgi:putative sigma-54 modulation protein
MNLQVNGHHVEVTPALRDYVSGKISRVGRHFDHVIDVRVTLSVDHLVHKAEVNLHVSGKDIFIVSEHSDMYAAIDSLVDKIDRQVLRHKGKLTDKDHDAIKHHAPE